MPLERFLEAARGRRVLILAGIEGMHADGLLNREMYRAWAYHCWQIGVHGLHLYNNCYNHLNGAGPHPVEELHDPRWLARLDKRYVVTRTIPGKNVPDLSDKTLSYPKQLPRRLDPKLPVSIFITIDDDFESARDEDLLSSLILRLRVVEMTSRDRIDVRVNGQSIPLDRMKIRGSQWEGRRANFPGAYPAPPWRANASGAYLWILCDVSHRPRARRGPNEIEVILVEKNPEVVAPLELYNVEIDVRYRRAEKEGNYQLGQF
jgi:hypothetical protein